MSSTPHRYVGLSAVRFHPLQRRCAVWHPSPQPSRRSCCELPAPANLGGPWGRHSAWALSGAAPASHLNVDHSALSFKMPCGSQGWGGSRVYSGGLTCLQSLGCTRWFECLCTVENGVHWIRFTGFKKTKNVITFFFFFSVLKVNYCHWKSTTHCFHASQVEGGSSFCFWCLFSTNYFLKNVLRLLFFALICLRVVVPFCLLNRMNLYLGGLKNFLTVEMSFPLPGITDVWSWEDPGDLS